MDENIFYTDLQKKIIKLADENNRDEIIRVLCSELQGVKLTDDNIISFCRCGYPLSYGIIGTDHKNETVITHRLLEEILREEADFDHYRLEYYCPKCGDFLTEIQQ